jgi:hypothetical protein
MKTAEPACREMPALQWLPANRDDTHPPAKWVTNAEHPPLDRQAPVETQGHLRSLTRHPIGVRSTKTSDRAMKKLISPVVTSTEYPHGT